MSLVDADSSVEGVSSCVPDGVDARHESRWEVADEDEAPVDEGSQETEDQDASQELVVDRRRIRSLLALVTELLATNEGADGRKQLLTSSRRQEQGCRASGRCS